ncbi:hypothetical protein A0H81_12990 [Grifola frondosa]|uniref:Uncharacterized protein n=1 Tax=Grifola frondosa TaxID=5627 RepID=A0A1C7LSV4_GRIFR|nr:hypothetical protein A0H81_12990 [Grifola frondosa]
MSPKNRPLAERVQCVRGSVPVVLLPTVDGDAPARDGLVHLRFCAGTPSPMYALSTEPAIVENPVRCR